MKVPVLSLQLAYCFLEEICQLQMSDSVLQDGLTNLGENKHVPVLYCLVMIPENTNTSTTTLLVYVDDMLYTVHRVHPVQSLLAL